MTRGVALRVSTAKLSLANALPGERVVARYTRLRGRYDEATAEQYLEPSPHRVEPRTHANICGGCVLQHVYMMNNSVSNKRAWRIT